MSAEDYMKSENNKADMFGNPRLFPEVDVKFASLIDWLMNEDQRVKNIVYVVENLTRQYLTVYPYTQGKEVIEAEMEKFWRIAEIMKSLGLDDLVEWYEELGSKVPIKRKPKDS